MTVSLAVPDVLVARAQAGDEAALEALYRAFEAPVYNLVRRMLRRPEDAEDVLQETFLEVVRNIKQYRGEGHLWGWVRRIASTKALMRIRRDQVRAAESLDEEPGKPAMHVGANIDLERAFERLSETSRAVVWLHDVDRKSTRLNSSHGYISYAVFCLKKKKENVDRIAARFFAPADAATINRLSGERKLREF